MYKDKEKDDNSQSNLIRTNNHFLNHRSQSKLTTILEKAKTLNRFKKENPLGIAHMTLKKAKTSDNNTTFKKYIKKRNCSLSFEYLTKKSPKELFILLKQNERTLFLLNFIICCIDLLAVIFMYSNVLKRLGKEHKISLLNNIFRVIYIVISIGIIAVIVVRNKVKKKYKFIEYLLRIKASCPKNKIKHSFFLFEVTIHFVNLIPFFTSNLINIDAHKIEPYLCFDIIISIIGTLRLYSISQLYKSYFQLFQGTNDRMLRLFKIKSYITYFIKTSIQFNPCVSLFVLFWFIYMTTSFIFTIMECHSLDGSVELCYKFSYSNLFWFITNTLFSSKI